MSYRGILKNDLTDCTLCYYMFFRPTFQKILGFAPPRNTNQLPDFWNPLKIIFLFKKK